MPQENGSSGLYQESDPNSLLLEIRDGSVTDGGNIDYFKFVAFCSKIIKFIKIPAQSMST